MRITTISIRHNHFRIALSAIALLVFLLCSFFSRTGRADTNSTSDEFSIKRDYMHKRVNDFYDRQDALDKQDRDRESAADEIRDQRVEQAKKNELARQQFSKERREKPPEDLKNWQRELDARLAQRELERQEFVKRRDEYNRESRNFDTIPPEEELGLESEDNH